MNREDNLIPFRKGHKKLPVNPEKVKAKRTLKELLTGFTEEKFDDFVTEFDKLRGKPKCDIYIKILEFVRPKVASVQFEDIKEVNNAVELLKAFAAYNKESQPDTTE